MVCVCMCVCMSMSIRGCNVCSVLLTAVQGEKEEDGVLSSVCKLQYQHGRQVKAITAGLNNIRHGQTCTDFKAKNSFYLCVTFATIKT